MILKNQLCKKTLFFYTVEIYIKIQKLYCIIQKLLYNSNCIVLTKYLEKGVFYRWNKIEKVYFQLEN